MLVLTFFGTVIFSLFSLFPPSKIQPRTPKLSEALNKTHLLSVRRANRTPCLVPLLASSRRDTAGSRSLRRKPLSEAKQADIVPGEFAKPGEPRGVSGDKIDLLQRLLTSIIAKSGLLARSSRNLREHMRTCCLPLTHCDTVLFTELRVSIS